MDTEFNSRRFFIDKYNRSNRCSKLQKLYCSGQECDNIYEILDQKEPMNRGSVGEIFQVCLKEKCDYIGKWQHNIDKTLSEAKIQHDLAKIGFAPSIKQILLCNNGGMIIMDGLKNTLHNVLNNLTKEQYDQVILNSPSIESAIKRIRDNVVVINIADSAELILKRKELIKRLFLILIEISKLGYIHGDLHFDNVMFDQNDKMYLIDFGKSIRVNNDYTDLYMMKISLRFLCATHKNLNYLIEYLNELIIEYGVKINLDEWNEL